LVDRLEDEMQDRLDVIRLNMQDRAGRELGARFGFIATPTFILFDADGQEIWRAVGTLDPNQVRQRLEAP
jgi:thioredoxin-related protein